MRFRRRLRGPHRRRAAGMKGDWIELAHTVCVEDMGPMQSCESTTPSPVQSFEWISPSDIVAKEDSLTIVRCVGEVEHFVQGSLHNAQSTAQFYNRFVTIDEGLVVLTTDDAGAVQVPDPRLSAFMERDTILWRRRTVFRLCATVPPATTGFVGLDLEAQWGPLSAHLDLRVKRRLVQGTTLVYVAGAFFQDLGSQPDNTSTIQWVTQFNMRGYVKF